MLASFALALIVCCGLLHILRPLATRIGLVDEPDARKTHQGSVPLIGGVAMFCGFTLATLTLDVGLTAYRGFFAAAAIVVVVGLLDDIHELSSRGRFGAQIGAALIMAYWGGVVLHDLGHLGGEGRLVTLSGWAIVFTVFATVGVINALNMSDGLDGLAGGLSLIALLGLAYVADSAGRDAERALLLMLAVVVTGFLAFNLRLPWRRRALVFMGDAGSMFLGFALTWFFIALSQGDGRAMPPVAALWLLMVPLFDTVWLILWRFSQGRSPTSSDVGHLHHVLQMTGMRASTSVWVMLCIASVCAVAGVAALEAGVAESTMFYLFLGLFALYCVFMAVSWHRRRLLWWPIERRLLGLPDRREHAQRPVEERRRVADRRGGA
ncbi:MAG: undecaprenyl/decaprenyl-phosphate alpha-N-acetylglucosaminyl 1-phosphate transferase [Gammaproteobacteria bacterium]|nr:undecaprenyl/decaprenyl-phosphate alpha-N-acetylglucosaminyl 1-phosphate transferase [Gammaproteobacteria bacterium]NIM73235.1 undecaprenyl/decaprenyl-phosphate alpha-N-acetylglucosaminyl 1-phosphate transferase [Gammaproteobacteria bacterium]NIN39054.1 undecaprenyl/decaprenyl-phosphate alpha-N-acetylglucosaminyl 1-phosphate transferase [Gammaproteobacteria bacterium]NIO24936.1 undecaprenyl/decaprenyl-phosphate alpha-N-acetylglucosaminyl 1-phosphate transferase [Gammaproteobacteria bacterium]